MLANFWLLFVANIIKVFIIALPDYSGMPPEIDAAITSIKGGINAIGFVLPFDTLFQIVAIVLTIEGAMFAFVWSNWLYNKLRGSG
jgi:hypothetical protein